MTIERVLLIGSKQIGLRCLETLVAITPGTVVGVVTIDDRADRRTAYDEIVRSCASHSLPLYLARDRKHSEALIREMPADLCIVAGWYWLFSKEIIELLPHGFIGIHFSLLPKYRGGSPLVWALINGEPEVGLSVFSFTDGVDEGGIWAQERISVGEDEHVSGVLTRLEDKAVGTLYAKWPGILNGTIQTVEQNHAEATYCSLRSPSDGEIYWRSGALHVYDFIRAQSDPYPGAYTWFQGEKLIVKRARRDGFTYYGTPGQVAHVSPLGVRVICGDNRSVILESVEWKSYVQSAHQVLKSIKIRLPSAGVSKEE